jgi:hypothetical protein
MTSALLTKDFSDYCAQRDAQNTVQLNVVKHTWMLCEALRQNFIDHSIQQHERSIDYADAGDVASVRYHEACIEDLKNGKCDYDFTFESGRKYHKVIMHTENQRSVHCFIDKKTGEVYKSASWKAPAKGVRYDLRLIKDREWLFENADWSGGYLYAR